MGRPWGRGDGKNNHEQQHARGAKRGLPPVHLYGPLGTDRHPQAECERPARGVYRPHPCLGVRWAFLAIKDIHNVRRGEQHPERTGSIHTAILLTEHCIQLLPLCQPVSRTRNRR